jgi:hypothetical protein
MQEKHIKEAEDAGLKYVGKATNNNANYRQYECENGHKISMFVGIIGGASIVLKIN